METRFPQADVLAIPSLGTPELPVESHTVACGAHT